MRVLLRSLTVGGFAALAMAWATPASAQMEGIKPVPENHAGRTGCLMCHKVETEGMGPATAASHADRTDGQCLWCHATDSPMLTMTPKTIPHTVEGRESCLMCHTAGRMEPVPDAPAASHGDRTDNDCRMCHKPAAGG